MKIIIELNNLEEAKLVVAALGNMQYNLVEEIIPRIKQQVEEQLKQAAEVAIDKMKKE